MEALGDISYPDLPVSKERKRILSTLESNQVIVVVGDTGSGKTTQLPKMALELAQRKGVKHGRVGCTQPRRIAAASVSKRVAEAQLQLKVPVFRRWGKKFFVVVDSQFFNALPEFPDTSRSNSELTWLSYPITRSGKDYSMKDPDVIFSQWDDVANALREGIPPEPEEILNELQVKLANKRNPPKVFDIE